METAIKIAIENQWKDGYRIGLTGENYVDVFNAAHTMDRITWFEASLDPLFWQSLGKGLGWGITCPLGENKGYLTYTKANGVCWKCVMHSLIDHLASGKDIESFFTELMKYYD